MWGGGGGVGWTCFWWLWCELGRGCPGAPPNQARQPGDRNVGRCRQEPIGVGRKAMQTAGAAGWARSNIAPPAVASACLQLGRRLGAPAASGLHRTECNVQNAGVGRDDQPALQGKGRAGTTTLRWAHRVNCYAWGLLAGAAHAQEGRAAGGGLARRQRAPSHLLRKELEGGEVVGGRLAEAVAEQHRRHRRAGLHALGRQHDRVSLAGSAKGVVRQLGAGRDKVLRVARDSLDLAPLDACA